MTTRADSVSPALARRCWGTLEPLHVVGYFAPETREAYVALGLHPRLSYFAARSAAFGEAKPEVVVATFYVFAPWLVHKALPAAWAVASPAEVVQARHDGIRQVLQRVIGEIDLSEALRIARRVCEGLQAAGRPLYAAHASLPWPEDDVMALWHAATLIREHRGDGHVAVLQSYEIGPLESLVLGGVFSGNTDFLRESRGWRAEEWDTTEALLTERGLLDASGALSAEGLRLRQEIEDRTDRLAVQGWAHAGLADSERLLELLTPVRAQVLSSGVLPGWASKRG